MRSLRWVPGVTLLAGIGLFLLTPAEMHGQQILQYGFETRGPVWKAGNADATVKVLKHDLTDLTAHGGQRCEHLQLQVEKGTRIHYIYELPHAPITDELNLGLWIKSNRPGIQLLCRVVLPRERHPNSPTQPMTVLIRCEPYQSTRWKRLSLRQPVKRLREQQQLLTHQLGRDIVSEGAYIDQLILNVYDGPGVTDVWIDDLEIGPVIDSRPITPAPVASTTGTPVARPASRRAAEVQLRGNQLLVSGKRFFLRGIRHTGTPLRTLREAGFNTVWLDESTPNGLIEDAANLGFWIVPSIRPPIMTASGRGVEGQLTGTEAFHKQVSRFLDHDAVLGWDLGSNLSAEHFGDAARVARTYRQVDAQRPVIADVWDGYRGYSRSLDQVMLGTHRWPLMTSLDLTDYRKWLDMRRRLASDSYCWTWIQTHLPDWVTQVVYEGAGKDGFNEPIGPQPEQIRLLAYAAIAAGYRGLAFWSDRYLADSHQGRDRLLALAVLNQELQLLERILMNATKAPEWIPTSNPAVDAAIIRTREGVLCLPMWLGKHAQYVPGQSATPELSVSVPGVPITSTAWEVSPGRIQSHRITIQAGGATVKLRNFGLTSAILFTSDLSPTGLVVWLQDQQRRMGRLAAQWLHDQAKEELVKIEKVQAALSQQGHATADGPAVLDRARKALDRCVQHRRNGEHSAAYGEAEQALRALRVLMRAEWDQAVRNLDTPSSSPYAVSYFTLPRHWQMLDQLRSLQPAASVLPGGTFETDPSSVQQGWIVQEVPSLDNVAVRVRRLSDNNAREGKQCLAIQVTPKDRNRIPVVLERTFVALHSPAVRLEPGTLVRISAWIRVLTPLIGSPDGALFYDSIGGEPLAIRLTEPTLKWKRYTLYRRVPASGTVNLTLALSSMGTVLFDDVRIEPLVPASAAPPAGGTPPSVPPVTSRPTTAPVTIQQTGARTIQRTPATPTGKR